MKRLIALVLIASTVEAGCSTSLTDRSSAASVQFASCSGEELYTGIFFGYGRAGGLIPTVSSYVDQSIELSAAQRQRIDVVIAEIKASNPDFFNQFARDIWSGDHVVIRAALERALKTTAETTKRVATSTKALPGAASDRDISIELDLSPAVDIETFIYVVLVVFLFVVVIDFLPLQLPMEASLVLDAMADDIAALSAI